MDFAALASMAESLMSTKEGRRLANEAAFKTGQLIGDAGRSLARSAFAPAKTRRGRGKKPPSGPPGSVTKRVQPQSVTSNIVQRRGRFKGGTVGGSIVVSHRELVCDVNSNAGSITVRDIALNAGSDAMFTWLSGLAPNFQHYKVRSATLEYYHNCASTLPGIVQVGFSKDPLMSTPAGKADMGSLAVSNRGATPEDFRLKIPAMPKKLLTRSGNVPDGQSAVNYDAGRVFVMTYGQSSNQEVGELYINYEIELLDPQSASCEYSSTAFSGAAAGTPFANPVTTGDLVVTLSGVGITIRKPGWYIVTYAFDSTDNVGGTPPGASLTNFSNAVGVQMLAIDNSTGVVSTTAVQYSVHVTQPDGYFETSVLSTYTAATGRLTVCQAADFSL